MTPAFCTHRIRVDEVLGDDDGLWWWGDRTCLTCGWHYPRGREMRGLREDIQTRSVVIMIDDLAVLPTEEEIEAAARWWQATLPSRQVTHGGDATVLGPIRMREEDVSG